MDTFQDLDDLLDVFGLGNNVGNRTTEHGKHIDIGGLHDEPDEMLSDAAVDDFISHAFMSLGTVDEEDEEEVGEVETVAQDLPTAGGDADDPQRDLDSIQETLMQGCGCKLKCFDTIPFKVVLDNVLTIREMLKETREAHILSKIIPVKDTGRCQSDSRTRNRCLLYFESKRVCMNAFKIIFDLKRGTLQRLQKHVCEHGIEPRVHGLAGRRSNHSYSHEIIKDAVQFLMNYAAEEGLPQPAPPRGRPGIVPVYLPVCQTKLSVHSEYKQCCQDQDKPSVGLTTFKDVLTKCVPHIKIMSPKEDVCQLCEDFIENITLARSEEDKLTCTSKYHEHVLAARTEREVYKRSVEESTAVFDSDSGDMNKVHFTFDFIQYLRLPHHAREKGPTFFIQPRKVQLFGFRVDGYRQYNYLIDENQTIGKDGQLAHGPDAVISMVDHALTKFDVSGEECRIHADNCFAQNKNRYVMAYLSWRTMTGRHQRITYMMQLPGHTRYLIDAGFDRIKQLYRLQDTDTVGHLYSVVEKSSSTNVPIQYGEWQWRAWKEFFSLRFKKVPRINSYYYFRFESTDPGAMYMRKSASDESETRFVVCKTPLLPMVADDIPRCLPAGGFSKDRMGYLTKHVRPLVRVPFRDAFCPDAEGSS